jgi:CRP-like cAMP-binding protein
MSERDRERLAPYLEEVALPARTTLCSAGQKIPYAVFPHDAITSTLMHLPEGESIEVGLMGAEGVVGLDLLYGAEDSVTTVVVQIPGHGVRIRSEDLVREVVEPNGEFHARLLRYSRAFFGMVAQSGACNASHGISQRLARWLLMVHDRLQRARFPLTHEFVALMLGVRRASITEVANHLRAVGAIDYDRGAITILRRDLLETTSCGCYNVIKDLENSIFV